MFARKREREIKGIKMIRNRVGNSFVAASIGVKNGRLLSIWIYLFFF